MLSTSDILVIPALAWLVVVLLALVGIHTLQRMALAIHNGQLVEAR